MLRGLWFGIACTLWLPCVWADSNGGQQARASAPSTYSDMQFYGPGGGPRPFTDAVRVGHILYLSGQIGERADGTLPASIEEQTKLAMEHMAQVLSNAGSSLNAVFKCTVMLADISQWQAFNKAYVTYFKPDRLPARSAFQAAGLVGGAAFELECMAYVP